MRPQLEQRLNHIWYGGGRAPAWLRALTPLYRLVFLLHRKINIARRPLNLAGRSILIVGNITVGGSGKTPLVIRLCRVLAQAGLQPGVISRGYGRSKRALMDVGPDSNPAEAGDEPVLIARRAGVPVVVSADRCAAAQRLFDQGVDIVIADDGLQHHRLPRSMEICVIDGARAFGNGLMLPAGPLREPLKRISQVDYVVTTGERIMAGGRDDAVIMQLVPGLLYALDGSTSWRLSRFTGCRVSAVAGIGNPQRFFLTLQQAGLHVSPHVFSDHHVYSAADFECVDAGLPIIMTEKDAVKCRGLYLENAWYLAVEASLPAAWEHELVHKLEQNQAVLHDRRAVEHGGIDR